MVEQACPRHPSRRTLVATGSTLLAGFGLGTVLAPAAEAAPRTAGATAPTASAAPGTLAAYRPVRVSSQAYAPTPAAFVVDALSTPGVRGTGWRAEAGDPQWIEVDLQAECRVDRVRLTFEADASDPVFTPPTDGNPRQGTTGKEILSSYATEFVVETSRDRGSWSSVYRTTAGTGGVVDIPLPVPVTARWVRMTARRRSGPNPLGLNGFEVYGTAPGHRPKATGWTDWGTHHGAAPRLAVAADGTVPLESGWTLTLDDWAGGDGAALSRTGLDTSRWLPATAPGTVLGSQRRPGQTARPGRGAEQPAHPGGAVPSLLVVPAGLRPAPRAAHRQRAAHLAGVRRRQPQGGDLAQRPRSG